MCGSPNDERSLAAALLFSPPSDSRYSSNFLLHHNIFGFNAIRRCCPPLNESRKTKWRAASDPLPGRGASLWAKFRLTNSACLSPAPLTQSPCYSLSPPFLVSSPSPLPSPRQSLTCALSSNNSFPPRRDGVRVSATQLRQQRKVVAHPEERRWPRGSFSGG